MITLNYIDIKDANGTPAPLFLLIDSVDSGNNTGIGFVFNGDSSVNMSATTIVNGYIYGEEWTLITPQSNTWFTQS